MFQDGTWTDPPSRWFNTKAIIKFISSVAFAAIAWATLFFTCQMQISTRKRPTEQFYRPRACNWLTPITLFTDFISSSSHAKSAEQSCEAGFTSGLTLHATKFMADWKTLRTWIWRHSRMYYGHFRTWLRDRQSVQRSVHGLSRNSFYKQKFVTIVIVLSLLNKIKKQP